MVVDYQPTWLLNFIFHALIFYVHGDFYIYVEFTQLHYNKKCVLLYVTGLLRYNQNVQPYSWNGHQNVVKDRGLIKLFGMLLQKFHVGLWSKTPMQNLMPLLEYLLPKDMIYKISFIFGREYCEGNSELISKTICINICKSILNVNWRTTIIH